MDTSVTPLSEIPVATTAPPAVSNDQPVPVVVAKSKSGFSMPKINLSPKTRLVTAVLGIFILVGGLSAAVFNSQLRQLFGFKAGWTTSINDQLCVPNDNNNGKGYLVRRYKCPSDSIYANGCQLDGSTLSSGATSGACFGFAQDHCGYQQIDYDSYDGDVAPEEFLSSYYCPAPVPTTAPSGGTLGCGITCSTVSDNPADCQSGLKCIHASWENPARNLCWANSCGGSQTTPTVSQCVQPARNTASVTSNELRCDFGQTTDCVKGSVNGNVCTYLRFDGTVAVFSCPSTSGNFLCEAGKDKVPGSTCNICSSSATTTVGVSPTANPTVTPITPPVLTSTPIPTQSVNPTPTNGTINPTATTAPVSGGVCQQIRILSDSGYPIDTADLRAGSRIRVDVYTSKSVGVRIRLLKDGVEIASVVVQSTAVGPTFMANTTFTIPSLGNYRVEGIVL